MVLKKRLAWPLLALGCFAGTPALGADDSRERVKLPPMMQEHMLNNMRDHLVALDEILAGLAVGKPDQAAETAERRLGLSALERHGASHMAQFMPPRMQEIGTQMHRAASRFALAAQEGDAARTYAALREVTASCVACHAGYRVR